MFTKYRVLAISVVIFLLTGCSINNKYIQNNTSTIIDTQTEKPITSPIASPKSIKSKEEVINDIKKIEPSVYKDVGTAYIPYEERRSKIIKFIDNFVSYIQNEKSSTTLSDKDYENIFNGSIRTSTYSASLGSEEVNIRLITYEGVGKPDIRKNWCIVQWWSDKKYGVQVIGQESDARIEKLILQVFKDNLYIIAYGNNFQPYDIRIETFLLKDDKLVTRNILKPEYFVNKNNWLLKNDNESIVVSYGSQKKPIFCQINKVGDGIIVYENVTKASIEFQFTNGELKLSFSDDIDISSMNKFVSNKLNENSINASISGAGTSDSYYTLQLVNPSNNPEDYIRMNSAEIINFFFNNFIKQSDKVNAIKITYQDNIKEQKNKVEVNMTQSDFSLFMESKKNIESILSFCTITSYDNDTINPGLVIDKQNTKYLTGVRAKDIALQVEKNIPGGNNTNYSGFTYKSGKIAHKFQYFYYSPGSNMISTIAWIEVDAISGKAYDVTWKEAKPLN